MRSGSDCGAYNVEWLKVSLGMPLAHQAAGQLRLLPASDTDLVIGQVVFFWLSLAVFSALVSPVFSTSQSLPSASGLSSTRCCAPRRSQAQGGGVAGAVAL
jgi:hypothetical protein